MKQLILIIILITLGCNKSSVKKPSYQKMSASIDYGQVHNFILDAYDATHNFNPIITRDQYNQLIVDMAAVVDSLYGQGEYILQRGVTMDELGAFHRDTLYIDMALQEIIRRDPDSDILTVAYSYQGEDFLDVIRSLNPDPVYMSILEASTTAIKKKAPIPGILSPPSYPIQSLYNGVAAADATGFKFEYSVAINEGAGISAAYLRGSMAAAIFSAVKERELAQ